MSTSNDRQIVAGLVVQADRRARDNIAALGPAFRAAHIIDMSPQLARAAVAEENLYTDIEREFGLLGTTEVADRLGSRAGAPRNVASTARKNGRLLAIRRGQYLLFPGFQFDESGIRPVIAEYLRLGREHDRSEVGMIQWLVRPTTYLDGMRPVDIINDPDRLLSVASEAFGVQW